MSTASKKTQQSAAATAATASGTGGGSTYFRRKKVVPPVVARKISNNNIKNSAKIASPNDGSKSVPTQEESSVAMIGTNAVVDLQQQTLQPVEAATDATLHKTTLQTEQSKDAQKQHATIKAAAAFRRIKPKVVIPQTQKPAKSILKNSTTPVKGNSSTESAFDAECSNETAVQKDLKVAVQADGENAAAKDLPKQDFQSEESVKLKQSPESKLATCENELGSASCKTDVAFDSSITHQASEDVAQTEAIQNCSAALKKEPLNSSIPSLVTSQERVAIDNATPASIPAAENASKQLIPESTPSNAHAVTVTKTIKRTISLSKLSPEIANMLKSSLGKKATKGTKSLQANGKAASLPKQPDPKASQANQENQSTQVVTAQSDKPKSTESIGSDSSATGRLPVLENRVDNISPKETTIVTNPPSSAKPPAPSPAKLPIGGQIIGAKKIQKVHNLTAEQQRLVLNSLKKAKVKRSVKLPDAASATKDRNVAATLQQEKSTPTPPSNESAVLPTVVATPVVPTVPSVSKDEYKISIISQIILPPLTVSSYGEAAKQKVISATDGSVASTSSSIAAVPPASSQQFKKLVAPEGSSTTVVPAHTSNQYPKLFICHKPATSGPFSGEAIPSSIAPQLFTPTGSAEARSQLIPPSVSVTVLPKTNHMFPGYPYFSNSPPRPYSLPTPVVTVRPTSAKHTPYANSSPPILPTPIVSVTASPMNSSNSTNSTMSVPVDPRIVPRIVIDECDAIDHDSQSSLTSTSSSSSSGQNTSIPRQQSKDRSISSQSTDVGTGCSPGTLDRLRAKSLKNLSMKIRNMMWEATDQNVTIRPIRQYSLMPNLNSPIGNREAKGVSHELAVKRIIDEYNKLRTEEGTTANYVEPKDSSACGPEPANTSYEQANVPEMSEFLGFSLSSIECTERDFEHRARTIDSVLEAKRKSMEDASDNEAVETTATIEENKREPTPPQPPVVEVMEKPEVPADSILKTEATDQNTTDCTDPYSSLKSAIEPSASAIQVESEINNQKIESPIAAPLPVEETAIRKTRTSEPTETALERSICPDSVEEVSNEVKKHIETVEKETATRCHKSKVPQESSVDSNRSDEDLEDVADVAAGDEASEPENTVEPNIETMMEDEAPTIAVPEMIDKIATGVDVIMAMAKLRRENRVLSLDDVSDREDMGCMDEPIATPTKPIAPPASGEQRSSKKKRKRRRKKRRDDFVELLLKHVNYDALIEDLVRQEKQLCNYISSSDEEPRVISPLQRYIRELEQEEQRASVTVEDDSSLSSPTISSEDNESLVEETILKRVLNKRRCVSAATDASSLIVPIEKADECSSTPQKDFRADSSTALSPAVSDDQRDNVQRSIICDRENATEEINKASTSLDLHDVNMAIIDPTMPLANEDYNREHKESCDILETNAASCDTPSGALVAGNEASEARSSPPKAVEMVNTHAKPDQLQRRTRRTGLKRASCRKRPAKRLAKGMASYAIKPKRARYNITPPVDMPLFDSSDALNNGEVVSDCSSGGLSLVEVEANSTRESLPARKFSTDKGSSSVDGTIIADVAEDGAKNGNMQGNVCLPAVAVARDALNRPGRSSKSERRQSGSSNSISSGTRRNSLSCDGDLSSSDDTKPDRRRKLRRKKRSARGVTRANRTRMEEGMIDATVDCDTNRSLFTTAGSNASNVSIHLPTASKPSTTSKLDTQYVITEVPDESATTPPRILEVINVRNNRVLSSSTRANRATSVQSKAQPPVPGNDEPRRGRNRSAKSVGQAANADSEEFVTPNSGVERRQQQATPNKADTTGKTQSDCESASSEPTDAVELEAQLVKCGNCGKEMLQSGWQEHSNTHNGVAFRVGIDYPIDLKDFKSVSAAIVRFMKMQRRAEVTCERCGIVKKSGLGMASHMNQCGLSEQELEQSKATCVHCGRKMKVISMLVHEQQHCRVLKEQKRLVALTTARDEELSTKEVTASGRRKRKSVACAEQKIKTIAKEMHDEPKGELVLEVNARGVSNAIMQCWLSHLKQSSEAACTYLGCPFFGMTSVHMQTEYNDNAAEPKPLYQCSRCTYMSTEKKPIYEHISVVHPQTMRMVAEPSKFASDGDSDVFVASGDGGTSADDTYSSSALETENEGGGKSKRGKGRKQTGGTANKSKSKKSSESPKGNGKKNAGKQIGTKAISSELLDTTIASVGGAEETEVYKEMVLQESIEYKQCKGNYHLMTVSWTQEFRREHYAVRLLFSELRPDVDTSYLRSVSNVRDYLPKVTLSMRYVQCNSKQYDPGYEPETFANRWQQKNTFDGEALGIESMFYCGGPVVSLDWLPLPDYCGNDCDQYLAVACKQSYDEYYNGEDLAMPHSRKCLVQIWNVGPIQNPGSTKITLSCPRLAFAIACDYGPIWQVAFCPSGCYNDPAQGDELDRLGLLAVAGSDGDVHLYALSRGMVAAENDANKTPRILPLRPVLLLSLSLADGPQQHHPASDLTGRSVVRISWTREKGHSVLAAGYSNGVVAVWNLTATSPLLCGTKNGIRTLLPVHKILHSSSGYITALDLHYSSGSRYLVVCNVDRRLKMYDLRSSLYQPQESLSMIMRSRIASVRWLLHFPVLVIAYDDALYIDRCAYSVHQPRDIGLRMFSIFTVGSEMTDLGTNDYHSMNAVATNGGDLVCHRPVPFVYGMNYKKLAQVLTTTIPMKINPIDDSADVSRYKPFTEEYGLLFSDTDKVPTAMDTAALHLKTWRRAKFNHYPAIRLNQIRWNPNSFSYTYYAIGYQAGFVRVRLLRS